jgi:hypothetical protein
MYRVLFALSALDSNGFAKKGEGGNISRLSCRWPDLRQIRDLRKRQNGRFMSPGADSVLS